MKRTILAAALVTGSLANPKALDAGFLPAGTTLEQHTVVYTASAGGFSGLLTYAVYREAGTNHLDFLFQINPNKGADVNEQITVTNFSFANILVRQAEDVNVNLPSLFTQGGGVAPTSVATTNAGANVSWNFATPIGPGQHSTILEVFTDATLYGDGFTNIIDGDVARIASLAPIPEPATFALLASGLALMAAYACRRANRPQRQPDPRALCRYGRKSLSNQAAVRSSWSSWNLGSVAPWPSRG
jgi:hypothetical protein